MHRLMSKRGQVTLFIILGLLVLIVGALYFVLRSTVVEEKASEARQILEDIPIEFNPIKVFTEDCLKVVGEEGIRMLGQHGGYIKPREWHQMKFDMVDVTDGDGVLFGPEVAIPYWYHNVLPNKADSVDVVVRIPTIRDMEKDAERWIEEELDSCVDRYRVFKESFSIVEGDSKAAVNFLPGFVRISLDHPLTITHGNAQNEMRHFYVEIPIDVVKPYAIATQITKLQQNYTFLENQMLNLIGLFSDVDENKLMPMTASRFGFETPIFWNERAVKEDVQLILSNYVPLLRVLGSRNYYGFMYPPTEKYVDVKQRIYNDMIIQLSDQSDVNGVDVSFNYLDSWEPYFSMGCEGGVCRPQSSITPVTFPPMGYFGMQRYKGVYDISYPVLVSLRTPQADGNDFDFLFTLEGNIRNNRQAKTGSFANPVTLFKPTLLCDRHQRVSGTVSVLVEDAQTQQPIPDASVSYVLGDSSCSIGNTDADGTLTRQFPAAIGGVVHAFANGYLGSARPLDTRAGKNESVVIELWPYHEVNISVQKKKLVKCRGGTCASDGRNVTIPGLDLADGWTFVDVVRQLEDKEQAMVSFQRISDVDDPIASALVTSGKESRQVRLPAGTYELLINLISSEEFVIPAEKRCEKIPGEDPFGLGDKEKCFTIPELRLDPLPNGGIVWNNRTFLMLDPASYYPSNRITLYAISYGLTDIPGDQRVVEDSTVIGAYKDPSRSYAHLLQPTYE